MTGHIVLAVSLTLTLPLLADPGKKTSAKWGVDDVVQTETALDFQPSPDGKQVVWVKSTADEEAGEFVSHLFRSIPGEKKDLQLTRGSDSCENPRWSPDGKRIAFLSKRPSHDPKDKRKARSLSSGGKKPKKDDEPTEQIWLLDASGGEPYRLTEGKRKVLGFAWAGPDALVYVAREDPSYYEKSLKDDKKDDAEVVDDEKHEPPVRLFKVEVDSKKVNRLTDNTDRISKLGLSPDGKKAIAIHAQSLSYEYDNKVKPIVYFHDLENGKKTQIFKDRRINLVTPIWTPDGKGVYASSQYTTSQRYVHAYVNELYYLDADSLKETRVDLGWERGLEVQHQNEYREGFVVTPDGFIALLANGVRPQLARYTQTSPGKWKKEAIAGDHVKNVFGMAISGDAKSFVYAYSTSDVPPQWHHASFEGATLKNPRPIARINEGLKDLPKSKVEVVSWIGANKDKVEGLLLYPHGYKAGTKYPLVVMIHGGPYGVDLDAWDDSWAYPLNLVASKGAFVFRPNYHGSSSYGLDFAESIAGGKYYDFPLEDIEKGVDHLIARGFIDANKMATTGWSNGAILSAALIVKNQRYKAASMGAGGAEWVADWGYCEFGLSFSNYYFGKSPLEDKELYLKMAPLYQFEKVKTPALIFQGDADRAVPPHHAWTQFRALQQLGKTTKLVLFPGEPHSLAKLAHQRRKLTEEMAWLDKYLFTSEKEQNLALKSDSPLAMALKLKGSKRDGNHYGVRVKGVLSPETVEFEGMQVGRFEVTRAQYAEFDSNLKVELGKENFPITGLTFEKAQAYCDWLSKKTGESYRLPSEDEGETLFDDRDADGENTLDYWAGYSINPDDAALLKEKIKELPGTTPLLREVGRFKGAGKEDLVFDLGGNAAEWVTVEKGAGKALGHCAACPAEDKKSHAAPPESYIGFRVLKGEMKK